MGADLVDVHAHLGGDLVDLVVDLGVRRSELLDAGDGAEREIHLDRCVGIGAQILGERGGVGARHLQVGVEAQALLLQATDQVLEAGTHLLAQQRLGHLDLDEFGELLAELVLHGHRGLRLAHLGEALDDVVAEVVDGGELGGLGHPLVGEFGEHLLLDVLDGHLEADLRLVGLGVIGDELDGLAGLEASEVVVEFGHDGGRADLVGVVVGRQTVDGLAVLGPLDVDRDAIRGRCRAGHLDEFAVLAAQPIDLVGDVIVGRPRARDGDRQALVSSEVDLGTHLDDGVEGDVALFLAGGDVDLGLGDGVDVELADGLEVELRHRLLDRLGTGVAGLDARLDDLAGHFSGTEPRHSHLAGDHLPRCIDGRLELRRLDGDRQLDLVALKGLDGGLHRARSLPVRTGHVPIGAEILAGASPIFGRRGSGRGCDRGPSRPRWRRATVGARRPRVDERDVAQSG